MPLFVASARTGFDFTAHQEDPAAEPSSGAPRPGASQLVGTGLAILILMVGLLGVPAPASANVVADAQELFEACKNAEALVGCVQEKVDAVLMAKGAEPAFQILENATKQGSLEGEAHNLAHHLGRTAVSFYPSPTEALRHCPLTLASGCFHGILERHFTNVGAPTQAGDVTGLCTAQDGRNRQFQCLHGLGHGLTMVAMHDLPQALAWCDMLPDSFAQDGCAGGVFMENVVADTSMVSHHHDHGARSSSTWVPMKADDLQYPCNVVEKKWWHACYWMQTSLYLALSMDLEQAAKACGQAPHEVGPKSPFGWDGVCHESLGRDAANPGRTHGDSSAIIDICMKAAFNGRGRCMYGAAQTLVNTDGKTDPGFAFCRAAPLAQKADCYSGVGGMVNALIESPEARAKDCQRSESKHLKACLDAAFA